MVDNSLPIAGREHRAIIVDRFRVLVALLWKKKDSVTEKTQNAAINLHNLPALVLLRGVRALPPTARRPRTNARAIAVCQKVNKQRREQFMHAFSPEKVPFAHRIRCATEPEAPK